MFSFLTRFFPRRRLLPIVTTLPQRLTKSFGGGESYTFKQAARVIAQLKLRKHEEPYAFTAVCSFEELQNNGTMISVEQYLELRAYLAELFDLQEDFTLKDLRKTSQSQHQPAEENIYTLSGPPN